MIDKTSLCLFDQATILIMLTLKSLPREECLPTFAADCSQIVLQNVYGSG
jgi:hypothetical protein